MVFYSGDNPDNLYLILKGKVEVLIEVGEKERKDELFTSKALQDFLHSNKNIPICKNSLIVWKDVKDPEAIINK